MALNLKNAEVEQLAAEVAQLARETKTEAIRRALLERRARLQASAGKPARASIREYLERYAWPLIPPIEFGRTVSQDEEDQILGYGPEGF